MIRFHAVGGGIRSILPGITVCIGLVVGMSGCDTSTPEPSAVEPNPVAKRIETEVPGIPLVDVTAASGVSFIYRNGEEAKECTILESLGGGVGLFDYDQDGDLDIFFPGGGNLKDRKVSGLPSALFRNRGDGTFEDVSKAAKIADAQNYYSHGCAIADYDNDGYPDILVTGFGGLQLWHNERDGTFCEVSKQAGLNDTLWSSSAAWADFTGDGWLDLYVTHYVNWSFDNHPNCPGPRPGQRDICPPRVFEPLPDTLFVNQGNGTFQNASREAGLRNGGKGLGVIAADVELDGDIDLYVANDTTDNFLYINDGTGKLEESGVLRGVARDDLGVANGSMGVDVCDFNNDGLPDLWAANYERESFALYRNEGEGQFLHVSQSSGITALGGMFVGFGSVFNDLDGDGDEDVLIANGHVILFPRSAPIKQTALLLINHLARFQRAQMEDEYFNTPHMGRGVAIGDLNGDLLPDAVLSNTNEPAVVLQNKSDNGNRHLWVRLVGSKSNRSAIGAAAVLETSSGNFLRQVKGGGSYLSTSDLALHWGIPQGTTIRGLKIRWPSGQTQQVEASELDGRVTIDELESTP